MPTYSYNPRGIASTRPKIPARAVYTNQTISNTLAQYKRPKLFAAGPQPMLQPDDTVWPWPWFSPVTMTSYDNYFNTNIDRIIWWPIHERGVLKIAFRLIALAPVFVSQLPSDFRHVDYPSTVPVDFYILISQFTNSPDSSPVSLDYKPLGLSGSDEIVITKEVTFWPMPFAYDGGGVFLGTGYYGSTILQQISHQIPLGSSDPSMLYTTSTKIAQPGPEDYVFYTDIQIEVPYDLSASFGDINTFRTNPLYIAIKNVEIADTNRISWNRIYRQSGLSPSFEVPENIRIFNTASAYYEGGA